MSDIRQSAAKIEKLPILKPYTEDPNSSERRRFRLILAIAVAAFCLVQGFAFAMFAPTLMVLFLVPGAAVGALVIWALPAGNNPPVRTMEVCFFGMFVTLVMWPNYLAIALPGLPWITLIRLTGFPMMITLLVSISQAASFRGRMGEILEATPWLWKLLTAFVVIQFLSIGLSRSPLESAQKFFVDQMTWTAIFFVSAYVFVKPGRAQAWAKLLCGMLLILAGVALVELKHGHVPWAGHIPGFLKIEDPAVSAILVGGGRNFTDIYRVQATFEDSIGFGEYISLTIPFVFYFALGRHSWPIKVVATVVAMAGLYAALLTHSRSAALGYLVAVMLWVLTWGVQKWRMQRGSILGPAVVLSYPLLGVLALASTVFVGRIRNVVWGGGETVSSTESRKQQWAMGLHLLAKNPIGHGVGRAAETLNFHEPSGLLTIDSWFLSALLEYGVIGFSVFFAFCGFAIFYAQKALYYSRKVDHEIGLLVPASISVANFILVRTVYSEEANFPLTFMTLGMVVALVFRLKKAGEHTENIAIDSELAGRGAAKSAASMHRNGGAKAVSAEASRAGNGGPNQRRQGRTVGRGGVLKQCS